MDLRPWGGKRVTLLDPSAPGWPREGERTEFQDVAQEWAWAYVRQLQGRKYRKQTGQREKARKVKDVADSFLDHRMNTVAHNTWLSDRTGVRKLLETHAHEALDSLDLQRWADQLVRQGYRHSTVQVYVASARRLVTFAGEEPPDVTVKRPGSTGVMTWGDEALETLRSAADELGMRPMFERALATGMRRNELMAVRWEDFNPFARTVLVARQRLRRGVGPLKGKSLRTALVLPSYWPFHEAESTGTIERYRAPSQLSREFRALLTTAGFAHLDRVSWHSLRHTYARIYLETYGGDLMQLASFLGHRSVETTRKYYGHFSTDAAVRLGRLAVYREA